MENFEILKIKNHPELIEQAAEWFHEKWKIKKSAYLESMNEMLSGEHSVPQWYVIKDGENIIAGLGVIENDFHNRKDLAPNVCAVYVEKQYRSRGIAGRLLNYVCEDFAKMGTETLYLLTDHIGFYERYGWQFFCMAQGDGEDEPSRMYKKEITL